MRSKLPGLASKGQGISLALKLGATVKVAITIPFQMS